jgi:proteasome assembly chaperone (PAC2) family protein
MATMLYKEPELKNPVMFCGWPGIGNIGLTAMDTLRVVLRAEEFGEIQPWDFFDPQQVRIANGLLKELEFPSNKFYFCRKASPSGQRLEACPEVLGGTQGELRRRDRDSIFFIGQQQPGEGPTRYAQGQKAYEMANLVLDVAEKFGCQRVYTSGAAVTQIHHTARPRVWAVPNRPNLVAEMQHYENTILMSQIEGRGDQGVITGLNGLLLGVAKERGLEAICLMGEIPYYLQGAPWPYPKGSKSVLEVLLKILDIKVDPSASSGQALNNLDELAQKVEENIDGFLESLYTAEAIPPEVRDEIEKLKDVSREPGPITEEEQKKIMEHIDELFDQRPWKDEKGPPTGGGTQ